MLRFVLGLWGYVKIPVATVQLSMWQEDCFSDVIKSLEKEYEEVPDLILLESIKNWKKHLDAQRMLTEFLRSGRQIGRLKGGGDGESYLGRD